MNREIKFRGKRVDNKQWVCGSLIQCGITGKVYIFPSGNDANESDKVDHEGCLMIVTFEVIPETVEQYTGEYIPECGEMIYGDDIIEQSYINKLTNKKVIKRYHIVFEKGHYEAKCIGHSPYGDTLLHFMLANYKYFDTKIVGNKHDDPELLEVENE